MTEPPEPRDPEEGGGEDAPDWDGMERDAVRDFVADSTPDMQEAIDQARAEMGDEAFDEAVAEVLRRVHERDDDMLLDQLGRGENEAGELGDMLGNWRDDVNSEPVGPIAENAQEIHDLNQQYNRPAEPSGPRVPHPEGTTHPMSLQESIGTLRGIADDTSVAGPINSVRDALTDIALAAAQQSVERLAELIGQARTATEGNDNATQEVSSTGEHAANAIEEVIDAINNAIQAATLAVEYEQQFRSTCGETGNRLAG